MAKKGKKGSVLTVDFSNVKDGGFARVKPGEYAVKVLKVEYKVSDNDKPYLFWELEIISGGSEGKKIGHITSLQEQALFNLRNVLLACKINVPKSALKLDLKKLIGLVFGVVIDDGEYKGKVRSEVVDVFPVTVKKGKMIKEALPDGDDMDEDDDDDLDEVDLDEDEDEEEEEEEEEEDEEEEEEDEVDYSSLSKKELKALCKERGIKVPKGADEEDLIDLLEEEDE